MSPRLFDPITIGGLTLANRIVVAPMCQYSAEDGRMTEWHAQHLGTLAQSGAGVLTIEASAVSPEGRISAGDVGLWDDATEAAMAHVLGGLRRWSAMPLAIQLAHAGRKASCAVPWAGGANIPPGHPGGWQAVAPSARGWGADDAPPVALDEAGIAKVIADFGAAAARAGRLGLDAIQIHMAHGYLIHQFLSPLANQRTDGWGGSLENRMRLALAVFDAVRAAFPAERPVTVRVSGTDWVEGGWDIDSTVALALALEARGCAAINVSSGGLDPGQKIAVGPGYQVALARAVRAAVTMPVVACGLITAPEHAEAIVAHGDADMVGIARAMLWDPRWPWHAAAVLGGQVASSPQYWRSQPTRDRHVFKT